MNFYWKSFVFISTLCIVVIFTFVDATGQDIPLKHMETNTYDDDDSFTSELEKVNTKLHQRILCLLNAGHCDYNHWNLLEMDPSHQLLIQYVKLRELIDRIRERNKLARKRRDCITGILGANCDNAKDNKEHKLRENEDHTKDYKDVGR